MNFHQFVQTSKTVQDTQTDKTNLDLIDLQQGQTQLVQAASTSLLIYLTSFTIRTLFIKKFSPAFSLKSWDLILPLCYLKTESKKYKKSQQIDGLESKLDLIFKGQMQESEKKQFLQQYNMKFWTNSQYWH